MVQAIKFIHFRVRYEIATARVIHPGAYCGSLFVRKPILAAATRLDFASDLGELFLILFRPGLNPLQQCLCPWAHGLNIPYLCGFATSARNRRFAGRLHSTFAGSGCSEAAFATRAALAIPANAAIFFWPSEPGCTTPQDMIRVAASSVLISTSMILLFGT